MDNRVVVVACSILVLALIATGTTDDQDQNKCTYTVKIKTADNQTGMRINPATIDPVDVRIGDGTPGPGILIENINSKFVKKDEATPFQAGATDSFNVTRECVKSKICFLSVKLHGEDDWIIEGMKVDIEEHEDFSSDNFFNFDSRKVSQDKEDSVDNCIKPVDTSGFGDSYSRSIFPSLGIQG